MSGGGKQGVALSVHQGQAVPAHLAVAAAGQAGRAAAGWTGQATIVQSLPDLRQAADWLAR